MLEMSDIHHSSCIYEQETKAPFPVTKSPQLQGLDRLTKSAGDEVGSDTERLVPFQG